MGPIDQYNEKGYVILRNFFNNVEIALIGCHVDQIYNKWANENEAEIYNQKLVNMHSLTSPEHFEDSPEQRVKFFEAIASVKLTELLDDIFGSGIHFHNTQLFFNPSNSSRLPYWHRDMQYSPIDDSIQSAELHNMLILHVRIPLIKEKGVEVVTGSHKRWDIELEHNVRLEINGHKNSEPLPNTALIDLSPGDILIFSAQMIHRGNYELNPSRKAFDLCVGKYHDLTSDFLDERVLPKNEEMANIANNQWYKLAREITANKSSKKDAQKRASS
jgi:ectoine hydroxylase-related dioxygenase (phytanoyl-CoA dioxygenase family)